LSLGYVLRENYTKKKTLLEYLSSFVF